MRHGSFLRNDRRTRGKIVLRGAENCTTSDLLPSALTSDARTLRDVSHGALHSPATQRFEMDALARQKLQKMMPDLMYRQLMASPSRVIFHVDMDAFFVSVEELSNPALKGKAVVVGGQRDQRGVVSAASYEARKFGVHSAMPLRTAAKLCPHAIFLDGRLDLYREYSGKAAAVLKDFSPAVEMASVDEAYVDMTGTDKLHGPPLKSAGMLHATMKERTGLNCSIGIGSSRLMAKICSDQAKPNGMLYIFHGHEQAFLAPLDVGRIPGVGKVTKTRLNDLGINKIGDLLRVEQAALEDTLGKWGLALAGKARGEDAGAWFEGEVGEDWQAKSISHEHTFNQDTRDLEKIESTLA